MALAPPLLSARLLSLEVYLSIPVSEGVVTMLGVDRRSRDGWYDGVCHSCSPRGPSDQRRRTCGNTK
jgi:hypothetical protein